MADLNFDHERIMFTPALLYIDYINLHFKYYLKKNHEDITPYDFTYLANIFYNPNCSQNDLAELLFVSESNVTQIIKRLEKNGLVKRDVDEKNKSRRILNLTEKGKEIYFKLLKEAYEGKPNSLKIILQKMLKYSKKCYTIILNWLLIHTRLLYIISDKP